MPWAVMVCHNDKAKQVWAVVARRKTAEQIKADFDAEKHWCTFNPNGELDISQLRVERVRWRDVRPANPFKRH